MGQGGASRIVDVDTTVNLQSIEKGHLKHFLGHICKKKKPSGDYIAPVVYQTFQYVSGHKSALKDFFSNNNVKIPNDAEKMMEQFFKGNNRKIAQMKQDGVMSIIEGKQPMSFKGYKFLAWINGIWDLDTKADRAMLSKAVKVMEKLSSIAVERSPMWSDRLYRAYRPYRTLSRSIRSYRLLYIYISSAAAS